MNTSRETSGQILADIKTFVKYQMRKMDLLTIDSLTINPFLVGTLNLQTPEETVEFFVNQRFQRGIVTGFGSLLEKRIARFFAESAGAADLDLKFRKNSEVYYAHMKSGSEDFTDPALNKTIETMKRLKQRNPSYKTIISFDYGMKAKISRVWYPGFVNSNPLPLQSWS